MNLIGTITVDVSAFDKTPVGLRISDLGGRLSDEILWDGSDARVLAYVKSQAAQHFGDVHVRTACGLTYYPDGLGL